jgi:hypothetical protein
VAPSRYDLDPDKREKHVGKLKFGADWQFGEDWTPDLIDHVLNLLMFRFSMPVEYLAVEESSAPWRIEALECSGPQDQRGDDLALYNRAVLGKKQLTCVRELLRLYDKYGPKSNGPEDFERLDPGDDGEKLREARRLAGPANDAPECAAGDAVSYTSSNLAPMKWDRKSARPPRQRGPTPKIRNKVKTNMVGELQAGTLTEAGLKAMLEKVMAEKYKASRDTCRKARDEALSEFSSRQFPTNDK